MRPLTLVAKHRMVRDERWKLVYVPTRSGVRYFLYDTVADEGETRDVADEHPSEVSRLKGELWRWMLADPDMVESWRVPRPARRRRGHDQGGRRSRHPGRLARCGAMRLGSIPSSVATAMGAAGALCAWRAGGAGEPRAEPPHGLTDVVTRVAEGRRGGGTEAEEVAVRLIEALKDARIDVPLASPWAGFDRGALAQDATSMDRPPRHRGEGDRELRAADERRREGVHGPAPQRRDLAPRRSAVEHGRGELRSARGDLRAQPGEDHVPAHDAAPRVPRLLVRERERARGRRLRRPRDRRAGRAPRRVDPRGRSPRDEAVDRRPRRPVRVRWSVGRAAAGHRDAAQPQSPGPVRCARPGDVGQPGSARARGDARALQRPLDRGRCHPSRRHSDLP